MMIYYYITATYWIILTDFILDYRTGLSARLPTECGGAKMLLSFMRHSIPVLKYDNFHIVYGGRDGFVVG